MRFRLIIGILLLIGSIASLVKALDVNKDVRATNQWSCVEGTIIKSELVVDAFTHPPSGSVYNPEIQYCYTVKGKKYTCDTIMFGGVTPGQFSEMLERYKDYYAEGSTVKIYYNPTKPENAVLEPHETWGFKKYYILASFLAVCGIFFVINYFTGFGEGLLLFMEKSS